MTSTARAKRIRASFCDDSRLTVSFQRRTELGMCSRARDRYQNDVAVGWEDLHFRKTRFLALTSCSNSAAANQILTLCPTC